MELLFDTIVKPGFTLGLGVGLSSWLICFVINCCWSAFTSNN